MYFYHFFNFICSFFISSHCWLVWQQHIHLHCKVKGVSGKKGSFLFIVLASWLIWCLSFCGSCYLFLSALSLFLCIVCIKKISIHNPRGVTGNSKQGWEGGRWGQNPNLYWPLWGGEWGWVQTKQSLWKG